MIRSIWSNGPKQLSLFDQPSAMHYAKLENSKRLLRLHALLSDGDWHTTMEIIRQAGICAVNSAVSELRRNGKEIECRLIKNDDARIFQYRMIL